MIEHCCKCGRERPDYFADPTCPKGFGYCVWVFPWKLIESPERTKLTKLSTPDLVKVMIETADGPARELIWLRVCGPCPPDHYAGAIYTEPGSRALPPVGTVIEFGLEHVFDLEVVLRIRGGLQLLGRAKDDTNTT